MIAELGLVALDALDEYRFAAVEWSRAWRAAAWIDALAARLARARLTRSVLVVDDDPAVLTPLVLLLRRELGVNVYGAESARAGIALWHTYRCRVAVVDLVLGPADDGVALLNALGRETRAVLVSGAVDEALLRAAGDRCRADHTRTKPAEDLVALVRQLLDDDPPSTTH